MKFHRYLLILIPFLLFGCKKGEEIPEHIMTQEAMSNILMDIHIAHAKVQTLKGINQDSAKILFRYYELDLFQKHNVAESIYYQSYNYYLDHPDLMLEVYTSLVDSLSLKESLKN